MQLSQHESVVAAWRTFCAGGGFEAADLRPEVAASWRRCASLPFRPDDWEYRPQVLSDAQTRELLQQNAQPLDIVLPVVKDLMALVAGSGFIALLTDATGRALWADGDPADRPAMAATNLVPGAIWNEETVGTCAIAMVMAQAHPCQVIGPEHYWQRLHTLTCSAAPICGTDGRLLAILNLSGLQQRVNAHTLGMVIASARAVERQLRLHEAAQHLAMKNQELDTSLSLIADGVILLDAGLRVRKMNAVAGALLQADADRVAGLPLAALLGDNALETALRAGRRIAEEEWLFTRKERALRCVVSARPVPDSDETVLMLRETRDIRRLVQRVRGDQARFTVDDITGVSRKMEDVRRRVRAACSTSSTVLILGESGTGKELVAHAIHSASARRHGPFITVNCGAIPRNLLESELFGYEAGAFTGAARPGGAGGGGLAGGGPILQDEIGDKPLEMQVSLLRVLQSREVTRVGGSYAIAVDVRVIAATNRNLALEVQEGNFRSDLLYRLDVLNICIPPFRERREDIPVLIEAVLSRWVARGRSIRFTAAAMEALRNYNWPGNARELENLMEKCVILSGRDEIDLADLSEAGFGQASALRLEAVQARPAAAASLRHRRQAPLSDVVRQAYEAAWATCQGDVIAVARTLGISRATAYRRANAYGLLRHPPVS